MVVDVCPNQKGARLQCATDYYYFHDHCDGLFDAVCVEHAGCFCGCELLEFESINLLDLRGGYFHRICVCDVERRVNANQYEYFGLVLLIATSRRDAARLVIAGGKFNPGIRRWFGADPRERICISSVRGVAEK